MQNKIGLMLGRLFCVAFFLCGVPAWADKMDVVPGYSFKSCTQAEITSFLQEVQADLSSLKTALENKYPDKPVKISGNPAFVALSEIVTRVSGMKNRAEKGTPLSAMESEFQIAQRIHYSIKADSEDRKIPVQDQILSAAPNVAFGPLLLTIPKVANLQAPIGEKKAALEAKGLCRPESSKPVSVEELAAMSPLEISRLETAPDHLAIRNVGPGDHFRRFLEYMKMLVRKVDKKYAQFDVNYSKRILFFDEMNPKASSPKVTALDRFGIKWGVKWGDEVHADVVATRIYMDLGGRYVDQKFYQGPGETILILAHPGNGSKAPSTFFELADQMLHSEFKFHAEYYLLPEPLVKDAQGRILGTGQVDESMIERESIDSKYLGCYYLKFKECQLNLYNPTLKRLGGVALSKGGSLEDRFYRGMLIFNTWINNPDFKEGNTSAGLLLNPNTGKFDQSVEFVADMGCAFFRILSYSAGSISNMSGTMVKEGLWKYHLMASTFFRPASWDKCTWADARWMALRIAKLKPQSYERAFADSGWPLFLQQLGTAKLIARRNDLVRIFKLSEDGIPEIPCNPDLDISVNTAQGRDYPVKKGKVNSDSNLVKQLEKSIHPEGLGKTVNRLQD